MAYRTTRLTCLFALFALVSCEKPQESLGNTGREGGVRPVAVSPGAREATAASLESPVAKFHATPTAGGRLEILKEACESAGDHGVALIMAAAQDGEIAVRLSAMDAAFSTYSFWTLKDVLAAGLCDAAAEVRNRALAHCRSIPVEDRLEVLEKGLLDGVDKETRVGCLNGIAAIGRRQACDVLMKGLSIADKEVRDAAMHLFLTLVPASPDNPESAVTWWAGNRARYSDWLTLPKE